MLPGSAPTQLYQQQLDEKTEKIKNLFSTYGIGEPEVFRSPECHFRMRAEFKIWHQDDLASFAMFAPGVYKKPVLIKEFPIGSKNIARLMPALIATINSQTTLRSKLFQVEFLTSTTGEALVTLIYHKKLDEKWLEMAMKIEKNLNCKIMGRSRGQKVVVSEDFILEKMLVDNQSYIYQQIESSFTQPNAAVCSKMLNWACEVSKDMNGDLLELYCGNGNFTLPIAKNFNKVLATEVSKTSISSAKENIKINKIPNIEVLRMSSEEITEAINKVREYRRLKDIQLDNYDFTTVFVDPPRAGLDDRTLELVKNFDNILYVSCNPETLTKNLKEIYSTHSISRLALFDQFPYTPHIECGVVLKHRQ